MSGVRVLGPGETAELAHIAEIRTALAAGEAKPIPRMEQLRRAHASAQPNAAENPAWFHTHNDVTYLLGQCDALITLLEHFTVRPSFHHDCDDYTRGYGDALAVVATQAAAALASVRS